MGAKVALNEYDWGWTGGAHWWDADLGMQVRCHVPNAFSDSPRDMTYEQAFVETCREVFKHGGQIENITAYPQGAPRREPFHIAYRDADVELQPVGNLWTGVVRIGDDWLYSTKAVDHDAAWVAAVEYAVQHHARVREVVERG